LLFIVLVAEHELFGLDATGFDRFNAITAPQTRDPDDQENR
jgi:hypothetical protein